MGLDNLRKLPVKLDPLDHGYGTAAADDQPKVKRPRGGDPLLRSCPACGARKGQHCRWAVFTRPVGLKRGGKKSKRKQQQLNTRVVHAARLERTTDAA